MKAPVLNRLAAKTVSLDNQLTPLEISELLRNPTYKHLPFAIARLLQDQPPVRYLRYELGRCVSFYSANRDASTLIIAFRGNAFRLMMPISHFLQIMEDDRYDVLVLTDAQRRHFDAGIAGYANSLLETLIRVKVFAETRSYRRIITYGTSMGGLPALRAGLWLGADRAVSIGGAFCKHPLRLMQASNEIRAFDLICACRRRRDVPVVTAFAARNERDVEQQAALNAVLPGCVAVKIDTAAHNVLHHLDQLGQLRSFYAMIFGDDAVSPTACWKAPALI
jgi:hypothetical protein